MERNFNNETLIVLFVITIFSQACCATKRAFGGKCEVTEQQRKELEDYTKHLKKQKPEETIKEDKGDINEIIAKCLGHDYKKPPTEAEKQREKENMLAFQKEIQDREQYKAKIKKTRLAQVKQKKPDDTWPLERQALLVKLSECPEYRLIGITKQIITAAKQKGDKKLYAFSEYQSIKAIVALNKKMAKKYPQLSALESLSVQDDDWEKIQLDIAALENWTERLVQTHVAITLQKRLVPFLEALSQVEKETKVEVPTEVVSPQVEQERAQKEKPTVQAEKPIDVLIAVRAAKTAEALGEAISHVLSSTAEGTLWKDNEKDLVQEMVFDYSRVTTLIDIMQGALKQATQHPKETKEILDGLKEEPRTESYRQKIVASSALVQAVFAALDSQLKKYHEIKKSVVKVLADSLSFLKQEGSSDKLTETPSSPNLFLALVMACFSLTYYVQGGLLIGN